MKRPTTTLQKVLARFAGARLIDASVVKIDLETKTLVLADPKRPHFDRRRTTRRGVGLGKWCRDSVCRIPRPP